MKKLLQLTRTLLVAICLLGGANFAWGDDMTTMTGILGPEDNSAAWWTYYSKAATIKKGESYTYTFTNYDIQSFNDETASFIAEIRDNSTGYCFDIRGNSDKSGDNAGWKWDGDPATNTLNYSFSGKAWSDFSYTASTFKTAYNGVNVTLTITRSADGGTVTVTRAATLNDETDFPGTWTCSGFSNSDDMTIKLVALYAHQDITKVSHTSASGVSTMYKTVDLSLFDDNSTYSDGTASFTLKGSKWSKLDLSSYYSDISGIITNVKLNFTENIGTGGRMCFGVFGNNKSTWGNGMPETANAVSTWGVCGNENTNRVYYCNSCSNVNTLTVGSAQNIEIDMDMVNKSFTFIQGSTTLVNKQAFIDSYITVPKYFAGHTWTDESNTTTLSNMTIEIVYRDASYFVDECKSYESSAAFATYIDGLYDAGSLKTVEDVFAAHSAWQVAQAQANGSTDYSKAIMNRTFELHNTDGWVINGDVATGASTDKDKYGEVEYGEGWSQYYTGWNGRNVSQKIATLPAGTYRLTAKVYSTSGSGAPVRLFANGQLSDAEAGDDHDPVLDFTVTGNEENIKIGIGGTGKNNDTDNTWGTWWYRVKNFTLEKIGVSAEISALGWSTFSSAYALDFEHATPSGLSAYMVTGTGENKTITLSDAVTNVPGNTGLLLNGTTSTTYTIPVLASSSTSTTGNLMKACVTETTVNYNDNSSMNYVLVSNEGTAEFQKITNDVTEYNKATVGAGKAYLSLTSDPGAPTLFLLFDNESTGISATLNDKGQMTNDKVVYNLNGQRVANPTKGLYILNGRKVVLK